jgi:DNA-binding PadR family transcriptional regulator
MTGYAIVKELNKIAEQPFHRGTIYPLLYDLEKNLSIKGEWTQKGAVKIKKYAITPEGLKALEHLREIFQMPLKEAVEDIMKQKPHQDKTT